MTVESRRSVRSGGFAFPILLIAAGVFVYLVNRGVVAAPRWDDLLALWPLLLVVIGVDLLVARRSGALAIVAVLMTVVLALTAVALLPTTAPTAVPRASVPLAGITRGSVDLTFGAGRLTLAGGGSAFLDVSSTNEDVETSVDQAASIARVSVTQRAQRFPFVGGRSNSWDVRINPATSTDVTLTLGAGDFDADLSGLNIVSAAFTVGAGDLRVVLPRPHGVIPVTIQGGASSITVEIPQGIEARVDVAKSGLTSVSGPTQTAGYATATDRVDVTVRAGVSSVRIVSGGPPPRTLDESANGASVNLATGEEIRVLLSSNPSTGFDWEVVASTAPVLELVSRTYSSSGALLGSSGTVEYRFRAAAAGTTRLSLAYRRSWESVAPERTFLADITVR